jgi:hypothetical protein
MKLVAQDVPDSVKLRADVAWRKACNLPNRSGVEAFEVEQDDLPIASSELVDQFPQTSQVVLVLVCDCDCIATLLRRSEQDVFKADERGTPSLPPYHRGGRIVRDAIHPGAQRTTPLEVFETAPERKMDLLKEVATLVGISFVRSSEPVENAVKSRSSLLVQVFPCTPKSRHLYGLVAQRSWILTGRYL